MMKSAGFESDDKNWILIKIDQCLTNFLIDFKCFQLKSQLKDWKECWKCRLKHWKWQNPSKTSNQSNFFNIFFDPFCLILTYYNQIWTFLSTLEMFLNLNESLYFKLWISDVIEITPFDKFLTTITMNLSIHFKKHPFTNTLNYNF